MAVTVMTKNKGSPLVTGEVGVSIINCRKKFSVIRQTSTTAVANRSQQTNKQKEKKGQYLKTDI